MSRKTLLITMIIVIISSLAICTAAPPLPDGGYSSPPLPDGSQYPPYPSGQGNQPYPPYPSGQPGTYPSGQDNQAGQGNQMNNQGSNAGGHPSVGPELTQPQYTPSASTGKIAQSFGEGQSLSKDQVTQLGGEPASSKAYSGGGSNKLMAYYVGGIEQWALYNGQWTKDPSAVSYYGRMNILVNNDQGQYIWSYEQYPNGAVYWKNWGYWMPGYHNTWFLGDVSGWHAIAIWGSQSGWSNVLWVYVW